jgi:hypothetical protein
MYTPTLTQEDKQKYNIVVLAHDKFLCQEYFRMYKKLEEYAIQGDHTKRNKLADQFCAFTKYLFDAGYIVTLVKPKMFVSKMVTDDTGAFRCIDVGYVW